MQRYSDTILDRFGNPASGVTVTVYVAGTLTLADLYDPSENTLDPVGSIGNPIITNATGRVDFAAPNGRYTLLYTGPGFTPRTIWWTSMDDGSGSAGGVAISAGLGIQSTGTVIFSNASGVSFGLNAGTMTASVATDYANSTHTHSQYLTTAMQSNASSAFAGTGGAITGGSITVNTAGVSVNLPAYLTTAQPPGAYLTTAMQSNASSLFAATGFTTTSTAGAAVAGTHDTAGLKLAVPAYLTTAMASNASSLFAATGFTTTSAAGTAVAGTHDTAGLKLAVPAYLTTAMQSNASSLFAATGFTTTSIAGAVIAGTQDTAGLKLAVPAYLTTAQPPGAYLTTAAQSDHSHGNPTLALTNINGTTASASSGFTLSLSAAGAGAVATRSTAALVAMESNGIHWVSQSNWSGAQNSIYVMPFQLSEYLSANVFRLPVTISHATSGASSGKKGLTISMALYSKVNDTKLTMHWSTSHTVGASYSSNVSMAYSAITGVGDSTSYNSITRSSGGTGLSASFGGPRELLFPMSSLMSSGSWYLALAQSSSTQGTAGNILNLSFAGRTHQTFLRMDIALNATVTGFHKLIGLGNYSATSGAFPATINFTQLNAAGLSPILFVAQNTV